MFSRDHDAELSLDLVAVDPEAQEDFAFNLAAEAVNNVNARVNDDDAIEKHPRKALRLCGRLKPQCPMKRRMTARTRPVRLLALRRWSALPRASPSPRNPHSDVQEETDYGDDDVGVSSVSHAASLASEDVYDELWFSSEDLPDFPA